MQAETYSHRASVNLSKCWGWKCPQFSWRGSAQTVSYNSQNATTRATWAHVAEPRTERESVCKRTKDGVTHSFSDAPRIPLRSDLVGWNARFGCTMTCRGQPVRKSVLYPSQANLVPIHWSRRDGRLDWLRGRIRKPQPPQTALHMTDTRAWSGSHQSMHAFHHRIAVMWDCSLKANPSGLLQQRSLQISTQALELCQRTKTIDSRLQRHVDDHFRWCV